MLDSIITSKTRIKLLTKFFLNPETSAYLRSLESEFGESTNAIRLELNRFEQAGLLMSKPQGNRKVFKANKAHPLFSELQSIVRKHLGLDRIVEQVIDRLGNLHAVFLTGDLARGQDGPVVDMLLVGDNLNRDYLMNLVEKAESLVKKKIRYGVYSLEEYRENQFLSPFTEAMCLWEAKSE